MPSRDVYAATRLAEASWRRDNNSKLVISSPVYATIFHLKTFACLLIYNVVIFRLKKDNLPVQGIFVKLAHAKLCLCTKLQSVA